MRPADPDVVELAVDTGPECLDVLRRRPAALEAGGGPPMRCGVDGTVVADHAAGLAGTWWHCRKRYGPPMLPRVRAVFRREAIDMAAELILEFEGVTTKKFVAVNEALGIDPETGEGNWPDESSPFGRAQPGRPSRRYRGVGYTGTPGEVHGGASW